MVSMRSLDFVHVRRRRVRAHTSFRHSASTTGRREPSRDKETSMRYAVSAVAFYYAIRFWVGLDSPHAFIPTLKTCGRRTISKH